MEILKSSDSPRVLAEKIKKNISFSEKGYKYHFDTKPPANPDEKTLWIDLFDNIILKEINTKTYADEYFSAHPGIDKTTFKYIGDDGKPTLEFKKMIYGDDYDPDSKYILQPKNGTIETFCKPIERQTGVKPYNLNDIVFNTKSLNTLYIAFINAGNLESVNTSSWDTRNVTSMYTMFGNCYKLQTLDTSKWDIGKVKDMSFMFSNCYKLRSPDVSKWNVTSVTTMKGMFFNCRSITSLDLSKWDTSKVVNMADMFNSCNFLKSITGVIDFKSCTNYSNMFFRCNTLTSVKVKNLPTDIDTFCATAKIDKSKVIVVS